MPRLVEEDRAGAGQLEARAEPETEVFYIARERSTPGFELGDGGLDVVAHQRDRVVSRVRIRLALVGPRGGVDSQLAGPGLEDEPAGLGLGVLEVRPAEDVAEKRPGGLGIVRVDQRMNGLDQLRDRRLARVSRVALLVALTAALALPTTAPAKGRILFDGTIPAGKTSVVSLTVHKAASFRVLLRVPTQGRARLFLRGKTAPKVGPLIDTKTFSCQGGAGSFYCRAAYEPLPKGRYTWRISWTGAKPAHVELTVRW
jgi:hypothetical protein